MKNDLASSFREFKPALRFLGFFAGVYMSGNLLYGGYVEFNKPKPDPVSIWVTSQSAFLLSACSEPVQAIVSEHEPIVLLRSEQRTVLRVFEGCNGLNVMIVFVSFVIAFGGKTRQLLIFLLGGCALLHLVNLLRIMLLYQTALYRPLFFYYFHKYFFTAVLYLVVFGLWLLWMRMNSKKSEPVKA